MTCFSTPHRDQASKPLLREGKVKDALEWEQTPGCPSSDQKYSISRQVAGQRVTCVVQAASLQFDIWHGTSRIKQFPIKGPDGTSRLLEEDVTLIKQEARSEYRRSLQTRARFQQGSLWA